MYNLLKKTPKLGSRKSKSVSSSQNPNKIHFSVLILKPIESKIFRKVFEIQANKKVGILRRNDKSSQMNNSKAPQYYDVGFEKHCLTCAFSKRRSFLMVKFQSRTFPFHFTSLYCRTQLESCLKLFLMGLNQLEGCLRRISGFFVLSIFSPK